MRKVLSFILILTLVLSSFSVVFAVENEAPADVKGTTYEAAVAALMAKGIVAGYPDGSFRPESKISRAEACLIVVKSMNPTEAELSAAVNSGFPDLYGYDWAAKYINYAVAKGVVNGYPDGTFRPAEDVTYNEMVTMLVLALGYQRKDLTGELAK
jgi:hypothetical protein